MTRAILDFLKTPLGWTCLGLVAIAAGFLAAGHAAHVLSVLAWVAILACPLLHILLHRGHARYGHGPPAPPRG